MDWLNQIPWGNAIWGPVVGVIWIVFKAANWVVDRIKEQSSHIEESNRNWIAELERQKQRLISEIEAKDEEISDRRTELEKAYADKTRMEERYYKLRTALRLCRDHNTEIRYRFRRLVRFIRDNKLAVPGDFLEEATNLNGAYTENYTDAIDLSNPENNPES